MRDYDGYGDRSSEPTPYRLIERGGSGPFLVTDDYGEAVRAGREHSARTGKRVWLYDSKGYRAETKLLRHGPRGPVYGATWTGHRRGMPEARATEVGDPT